MSKALDYLIKARPEAMESYFTFLKQAGSHLDKKTAALISVITKVHAKTANGLRQYLPRALKEGASADEIIDALLFAMPALGFSKIVWAMDVILEMDLPEFAKHKDNVADAGWRELTNVSALKPSQPSLIKAGRDMFYAFGSETSATVYSAECPHNKNIIPATGVEGMTITCPFHDWKFDLSDGRCLTGGNKPLKTFETKVENGKVWIRL
jgi:nitrite reductase/ring-hydroxylating ferredoxin subunit/alkylhydroperoxidase/carboxymuconolactone decarboxylase family protein YurZ